MATIKTILVKCPGAVL